MRRSGRDDSAGKEVRIEDKARGRERDVAHVPEGGSSWATSCFSRLLQQAQYDMLERVSFCSLYLYKTQESKQEGGGYYEEGQSHVSPSEL
ncbi:hypothetical protein PoB_007651200 [Plakobranchus ocellatus]|uniref:Uncharacterized protein n=1 Tax=Plakobranchus ocellatus TaxID=259542 RepID=A0AAV4E0A8_9GAST|nr:hypothetical protein PoB_007651200 [Plakobranchus ocellatus]